MTTTQAAHTARVQPVTPEEIDRFAALRAAKTALERGSGGDVPDPPPDVPRPHHLIAGFYTGAVVRQHPDGWRLLVGVPDGGLELWLLSLADLSEWVRLRREVEAGELPGWVVDDMSRQKKTVFGIRRRKNSNST